MLIVDFVGVVRESFRFLPFILQGKNTLPRKITLEFAILWLF